MRAIILRSPQTCSVSVLPRFLGIDSRTFLFRSVLESVSRFGSNKKLTTLETRQNETTCNRDRVHHWRTVTQRPHHGVPCGALQCLRADSSCIGQLECLRCL